MQLAGILQGKKSGLASQSRIALVLALSLALALAH